jgi:glycerophosphoryl diester phosphodiesterase
MVVQPWTVDDRAKMDALLAMGVDGIITDEPALLKAAISEMPAQ